jgi:diaminopimelate epimerase
MSGAGNDFILLDNDEVQLSSEKIKILCHRNFGIGADGILIIKKSDVRDFKVYYYNSDGSDGALCVNGARCVVKYLYEKGRIGLKSEFEFVGQTFKAEVIGDELIRLWLNPPIEIKTNFRVKAAGQLINANYIDIGSKHLVIFIDDILVNPSNPTIHVTNLEDVNVTGLGRELRYHKDFGSNGLNVNFIKILGQNLVAVRTYERGVEAETLACGSGSASSAIIAFLERKLHVPIKVLTYGGTLLEVDFEYQAGKISDLSLTGPAKKIFEGEIDLHNI